MGRGEEVGLLNGSQPDQSLLFKKGSKWLSMFNKNAILDFLFNTTFRSAGQAILTNNPVSGMLICIAIGLNEDTRYNLIFAIVSCMFANIFASMFINERENVRNGLYGYNAFMIGLVSYSFLKRDNDDNWDNVNTSLLLVGISLLSVIVGVVMEKVLSKTFETPMLVLPFNLITMALLIHCKRPASNWKVDDDWWNSAWASDTRNTDLDFGDLFHGIVTPFHQIFLGSDMLCGGIVMLAILLGSTEKFIAAVMGSAVSFMYVWMMGGFAKDVRSGVWQYNAVLTCIAMTEFGTFSWKPFWKRLAFVMFVGGFMATFTTGWMSVVLGGWELPMLSLPFCVTAIICLGLEDTQWNSGD